MKKCFSSDLELFFIQVWYDILSSKQGAMVSQAEKLDEARKKVNEYAKEIGHDEVTNVQLRNKIDSLRKKGKDLYKTVRTKTTTGALVEDDYDLEVCWLCRSDMETRM